MRLRLALFASLSITLPALAAITGTIMTSDGQPIAGARVSLRALETPETRYTRLLSAEPEQPAIASATTDAKGTFSMESPDEPVVELDVFAAGYAPAARTIERDEELGAMTLIAAPIRSGSVMAGGKPLAGSTVVMQFGSAEYVVRSDEKGRFDAPDPRTATRIVTLHPDYAIDQTPPVRSPFSASALNRTLEAGVRLTGRVTALRGGAAVAGATVMVDGWPLATSGEDGSFTIAHAPRRWSALTARTDTMVAEIPFKTGASHTLQMTSGGMLSGQVLDAKTNRPVAGAFVRANEQGPASVRPAAITDAKGNYALLVAPGSYSLDTSHPAYKPTGERLTVASAQTLQREVSLSQLARVTGVVVNERKEPVVAARIGSETGGGPMTPGAFRFMRNAPHVVSGTDGRFSIRITPELRQVLRATKRGLPDAKAEPLQLAPGERRSGIVLTIPTGVEVTGRVVDADDNPLSGVAVTAAEAEPGNSATSRIVIGGPPPDESDVVRTASDGTFALRLREGSYDLTFRRDGYSARTIRGRVISPGGENVVNTTLEPASEIQGRVVRGGNPVEGVSVMALISGSGVSARTASDGSFTLSGIPAGPTRLIANKRDEFIEEFQTVTAPANDVVIEVAPGGRVTGRVVEKGSRKPVTAFEAGISRSQTGGSTRRIAPPMLRKFTSDDGSFTLENVPAGETNLVATAPRFGSSRVNVTVEEGKTVSGIEIELAPAARLTGRVTGPDGSPVQGVSVRVAMSNRAVMTAGGRPRNAMTNAKGEYELDSLEPGDERIEFLHANYVTTAKEVSLKEGETRLDAQLSAGQRVRGSVVTESGAPVADAQVHASAAGGSRRSVRTDAGGAFEFEALAPARYRFSASKSGHATGIVDDFEIATGAPVRIVLGAGGTIYGRVTGLSAAEMGNVRVYARGRATASSASVDPATGSYRIEGAPTGTLRVAATVTPQDFGSYRTSKMETIDMDAGGVRQVDLEFGTGSVISGRITRNGEPLTGASIGFTQRGGVGGPPAHAVTNERGMYSVSGLADGTYNVVIYDRRAAPYSREYEVRGSATFDIDFATTTLRGRVINAANSEAIEDATVQLRSSGELAAFTESGATTDMNGTFVVEGIAAGTYALTVTRKGFGSYAAELQVGNTAPAPLEIRLARTDDVTLRVIDARDGRLLAATVFVFDMHGRLVHDGRRSFGPSLAATEIRVPLAPGSYSASVRAAGYAPRNISFTSPSKQTVGLTPGGTLFIESKHAEPRRYRLVDATGLPYPRPIAGPGGGPLLPAPGTTTVTNIAPGRYTLQLLDDRGAVLDAVSVTIEEGGVATAQI